MEMILSVGKCDCPFSLDCKFRCLETGIMQVNGKYSLAQYVLCQLCGLGSCKLQQCARFSLAPETRRK